MTDGAARAAAGSRDCRWLRKLSINVISIVGFVILLLIVLAALFAPVITKYDPTEMHITERFRAPSAKWPMGTDGFGRCSLSRVIHGARISLTVGVLVVGATGVFGVVIGLLAGYYPVLDKLLMAIMDGLMAFPALMLGIAIGLGVRTVGNPLLAYLVVLVLGLVIGQVSGVLFLGVGTVMIIGLFVWLVDALLIYLSVSRFNRSALIAKL